MFDANLKILREFKNFVTIISNNPDLLEFFSISNKSFIRNRKLPFARLVLLISKLCKKSLSIELENFFQEVGIKETCSVSAFSQQRQKLEPCFFQFWNHLLQNCFYKYYGEAVKKWKSYRVIAVDGSTINLMNNKQVNDYFGTHSNQATSMTLARTLYQYDVLNEIIISAKIAPFRRAELTMAYASIDHIEEDMLSIYDRNFYNFKTAALHMWQERERKFVMRAKETQTVIAAFIKSGKKSSIIEIKPSPDNIKGLKESGFIVTKDSTLKVRFVRIDLPNSIEVLVTNLWEEDGHPTEQFKDLYFMRWGIETNISVQKNILGLESFSGLTLYAVLQDFFTTVMITNLHSILIKEAQEKVDQTTKHRKYPMKINKNKSFGKLKVHLIPLLIKRDVRKIINQLNNHLVMHLIPIIKGRNYSRVRKNYSRRKHRTLTNFKPCY